MERSNDKYYSLYVEFCSFCDTGLFLSLHAVMQTNKLWPHFIGLILMAISSFPAYHLLG